MLLSEHADDIEVAVVTGHHQVDVDLLDRLPHRAGPKQTANPGPNQLAIPKYAYALADCRSCLAALADQSPFEQSVFYERLLLLLDALHGDCVPALYTITGMPNELYAQLMAGLDRLIELRRPCD